MNKDVVSGIVLLGIAGIYYVAIGAIPQSSLSDDVSPRGLPLVLAAALAITAVAIMARGVAVALRSSRGKPSNVMAADANDERYAASVVRALGVIGCGVLYVLAAWLAGYIPAIAILILAMALYEGMSPSWRLVAVAIGGAFGFWLVFVKLLGVAQPIGMFAGS